MTEKRRRRRRSSGSGSSFGIFKCFRPAEAKDDEAGHRAWAAEPAFVVQKGGADDGSTNKKGRRGLSAGFKAVFSDTSLGKKSRKSKSSRDSDSSSKGKLSSSMASDYTDSADGSRRTSDSSISAASSPSLDSSLCSSLSASSRSYNYSRRPSRSSSFVSGRNNKQRSSFKEDQRSRADIGLRVLFVALLAVVLWGKILAIICTSIWLYIMTNRTIGYPSMTVTGCNAADSSELKKKIVLGGFLDRKPSMTRL